VTIHDTATVGTTAFDANALAKSAGGTPFKRPENGAFRPGGGFREFFFTETGDTNAEKAAGARYGQWGGIFTLMQRKPTDDAGTLSLAYLADEEHAGLDNLNFAGRNSLVAVEDAGDTLHTQRGTTDSANVFDVRQAQPTPVRWIAQGRDPIATARNADNELTGIMFSDGAVSLGGLLGTRAPRLFTPGTPWRAFVTNQHGQNLTQEIVRTVPPRD
jgi:secreted PhoX family phosphatase